MSDTFDIRLPLSIWIAVKNIMIWVIYTQFFYDFEGWKVQNQDTVKLPVWCILPFSFKMALWAFLYPVKERSSQGRAGFLLRVLIHSQRRPLRT